MNRIRNLILTVCFCAMLIYTAITTGIWERFVDLLEVCAQEFQENDDGTAYTLDILGDDLLESLSYKTSLVELSGSLMKRAGIRSYYNTDYGINITTTGYHVGRYDQTSTDYEVEQMIAFKEYLDDLDIQLLYVSEPTKYIDDSFYQEEFGGESYINRNTDLFLERIGDAGISYIDLRENIIEEDLDSLSLFYRTDHHWTVPASKWAAQIIAERLNEEYGYSIDLSLYDDELFYAAAYKQAWLGEQGRKVAKSYIGLDDYTMIEPLYETSYTIYGDDTQTTGSFDLFINKTCYDTEADPYTAGSWHYSYSGRMEELIHNNNAEYGNVLVLGDSYEASMLPFLTLGIENVTLIIPRELSDTTVREIVEAGEYDTVIIAYAQFMIGAHDDTTGANYKMFTLE